MGRICLTTGGQERQYERGDAEGAKVIRTSQDPGPGLGPGQGGE